MVIRQRVSIDMIESLLERHQVKDKDKIMDELKTPLKQPAPPPPEGGISVSRASKKYRIPRTTISGWVLANYIPTIKKCGKERYISENIISEVAKRYDRRAPIGNRQILKILSDMTSI